MYHSQSRQLYNINQIVYYPSMKYDVYGHPIISTLTIEELKIKKIALEPDSVQEYIFVYSGDIPTLKFTEQNLFKTVEDCQKFIKNTLNFLLSLINKAENNFYEKLNSIDKVLKDEK